MPDLTANSLGAANDSGTSVMTNLLTATAQGAALATGHLQFPDPAFSSNNKATNVTLGATTGATRAIVK